MKVQPKTGVESLCSEDIGNSSCSIAGMVIVAQASVSASMLIAVMVMFSGLQEAGEDMMMGVLLLMNGHFGPLQVMIPWDWHGHLHVPGLLRQSDVAEHLW